MNKKEIINKFWSNVEKTDFCWIWKGGKTSTGYGDFRYGHKDRVKAHRFSYLLHNFN